MRRPAPVKPESSLRALLQGYWRDVIDAASTIDQEILESAASTLLACHERGRVVFVAGNGGSAATASHFACDLAKGVRAGGLPPFRVVALTDNVPLMTAWGNDTDYQRIFAEQLATLARPGDVLVAISASGNSPNILLAAEAARAAGATTLALTGKTGGKLAKLADLAIRVPLDPIEQVEDAHVVIAHSLCVVLRDRLQAESTAPRANGWRVEEVLADLVADLDL